MSERVASGNGHPAAAGQSSSCIDGLLWIGQTYPEFFCGSSESCLNPARPQGPHCFVHEADRRGVSRRVPHVPPWAVPGESRIFLAHKGGEREPWRGRIFGYFLLERIEVMAAPDSFEQDDSHAGEPIEPSPEGKLPDKGKGKRKGGAEMAGSDDGDEIEIDGESENGGVVFLPTDEEELAEHRGCSRREKPGAVYVVDGLEAEIADAFADRLDRGAIREDHDEKAGTTLFNEVVDEIAMRHAGSARVPRSLRGKAHARGELVLFDDPPLFEQRPQAAFRGLAHIDGNHLLDQVAAGVARARVHSCRKRSGVTTQGEVVAMLAERAHANKAITRELLTELSDLAREELSDYEEFRIPGIGTLKRKKGGQLAFRPYKALREKPR